MKLAPVTLGLAVIVGLALPAVAFSASGQASPGVSMADLSTLFLGLLFVLVVIVACAWLIKRMGVVGGTNNNTIKVLAVRSVGSRERIALVEVGGQQLLLGVTQQNINTLHTFPEPVIQAAEGENNSEFAQKLHQLMSRK